MDRSAPYSLHRAGDPLRSFREASESIRAHREAQRQLEDVRALCIYEIHSQGATYAEIAASVELSRARIQQLAKRGQVLVDQPSTLTPRS